ncbi:sensor histidine kinase [Geoalkalibacter halelectricus]|uniref:Oxygen sensor histidine kinase NreB n=1 Tax=Geoalkalibacter halelectricus TaxID=2847045 RepID=A0ABY5ZRL5_9BACT|nr:sensor histidine kinase [Geoalkalibacter halelectricus]MDO3378351.1 sensor histidine kinase [Geoalkalibacter halelectricus]UWZ80329.1 sensor histidine kinase [Geoalkalibacter halelectricus]
MLLLNLLPGLYPWARPLIDSAILLLLVLVPVYFFIYRPMNRARQALADEARMLSRQLIHAVEGERARLGRDLHDDAAQYIAALKMAVATLANTPGTEDQGIKNQLLRIDQLLDQTRDRVHQVATSLLPPDLSGKGLVGALQSLTQECARRFPQTRITFSHSGREGFRDAEIGLALYRVCQEGLCNALRHGQPQNISVDLCCSPDLLRLTLRDDGQGFDADTHAREESSLDGIGLLGMRERVLAVGGSINIRSSPGGGTLIQVVIPVEERANS